MRKLILLLAALPILFTTACKKEKAEPTLEEILATGDFDTIVERLEQEQKNSLEIDRAIRELTAKKIELDTTVKKLPLVTALQLQDSLFKHYVEVQGSVKTKDDVMIYPEFSGVMTNLYVREGQYIRKGALVARVDDGGMKQQIAQQEVQLDLAKTTYERQKRLWDQNIGSEIQYLQAKSNVESLEKAIAAMQSQLSKVNVYAPFSGIVEEVITKQGQVVSPGATPLFRLVNLGTMYVEAEVPESYLPKIKRGTQVEVEFEALDRKYNSTVRRINNTINPNSRSFIVEVNVPNKDRLVKPNLIANLRLNDYTNKNAILIPSSLILENANGDSYVFVADSLNQQNETMVSRTPLELGESTEDGYVEVLTGLETGQQIIEEGAKNLEDGDEVRIYSK
ncbi:MAG: efflux RND transporter periplasmic adaptor subunit [Saprospiraceae bacterium]|nr:efflux RND transporter periplasmic adaptor subunit [Saprospiraceae bacterium]